MRNLILQIRQMMLHRESALLAISLEDRSLEIVDIITRKIVRKFFDIHNGNMACQVFNERIQNKMVDFWSKVNILQGVPA